MKFESQDLIQELVALTHQNLNDAEALKSMSVVALNKKASETSWSALECVEHLNRYGYFYMPEISKRIQEGNSSSASSVFKSGWLGNYFSNSMKPKAKLNTMKTFASMNPNGSNLDASVLDTFIDQQKTTLELLEMAREVDLTKIKTAISISKWIKLRLGDTFRVVIYHNQRHMQQALRAVT